MNEKILKVLMSNQAKTFYWTTFNGALVLLVAILNEFNAAFIPFAIAGVNYVTKYINKKYLIKK